MLLKYRLILPYPFQQKKVLSIAIFHLHTHKPLLTNTKIDLIKFDRIKTWFRFFEFLNKYLQKFPNLPWDKIVQTWILFSKVRFLVTLVCRLSNCFQQKKWQACSRISWKIYTYSFFKVQHLRTCGAGKNVNAR